MSELYEYCNENPASANYAQGLVQMGQTFTPTATHKILSVRLKLYRGGSPGTATIEIRVADGSGHPTGTVLCSGTIDADTLTDDNEGLWYLITLGDGSILAENTMYAITVKASSASSGNNVLWKTTAGAI